MIAIGSKIKQIYFAVCDLIAVNFNFESLLKRIFTVFLQSDKMLDLNAKETTNHKIYADE